MTACTSSQHTYSGTLEFFYDIHGGTTIGALWEPSLSSKRPFRVLAGFSSRPDDTPSAPKSKAKPNEQVVLNRDSVLAEIERLGEGLVKSIVVQN